MSHSTTAPILAGLKAAEHARPTTPTSQRVPGYYNGRRFWDQAAADAERARDRKALLLQMKHQPDVWGYA